MTSYSGLPSRVVARVDLPDPLGPIRACTSPAPIVRSTPRRISADAGAPIDQRGSVQVLDLEERRGHGGQSRRPRPISTTAVVVIPAEAQRLTRRAGPASTPGTAGAMRRSGPVPSPEPSGNSRKLYWRSRSSASIGQVAGVGPSRRAGPPQQPPTDPALVVDRPGRRCRRPGAAARRAPRSTPRPGCCGRGSGSAAGRRCAPASGRSVAGRRGAKRPWRSR